MKEYITLTRHSNSGEIHIFIDKICSIYRAGETTKNTKIELDNGITHTVEESKSKILSQIKNEW